MKTVSKFLMFVVSFGVLTSLGDCVGAYMLEISIFQTFSPEKISLKFYVYENF